MALPFFFTPQLSVGNITLDEDTSKHMTGVLRMKTGAELLLTAGNGTKAQGIIIDDHRKRCVVRIDSVAQEPGKVPHVCIAISLLKNTARFEWFLEKATEIGVKEIIPLVCARTEKERFRFDRMQHIIISAMLQSQQCRLPRLHEPTAFGKALHLPFEKKFIAHCEPGSKTELTSQHIDPFSSQLILIGPEGDFTPEEISLAIENKCLPVSLGQTRLRTETAGIAATVILCMR